MSHSRPSNRRSSERSSASRSSMPAMGGASDVRALNSSVLLLSQKMQYLIRNEKVLGRNLLVLNRKFDELSKQQKGSGADSAEVSSLKEQLSDLSGRLDKAESQVLELRDALVRARHDFAKVEDLKEMRYVVDAINPIELVTIKQLDEILEKQGPAKSARKK